MTIKIDKEIRKSKKYGCYLHRDNANYEFTLKDYSIIKANGKEKVEYILGKVRYIGTAATLFEELSR